MQASDLTTVKNIIKGKFLSLDHSITISNSPSLSKEFIYDWQRPQLFTAIFIYSYCLYLPDLIDVIVQLTTINPIILSSNAGHQEAFVMTLTQTVGWRHLDAMLLLAHTYPPTSFSDRQVFWIAEVRRPLRLSLGYSVI